MFLFGTVILATVPVLPHCNVTLNMAAITLTNATTTLEPKMTVLSTLKRQCGAESVQVHIALLSPRNARWSFVYVLDM